MRQRNPWTSQLWTWIWNCRPKNSFGQVIWRKSVIYMQYIWIFKPLKSKANKVVARQGITHRFTQYHGQCTALRIVIWPLQAFQVGVCRAGRSFRVWARPNITNKTRIFRYLWHSRVMEAEISSAFYVFDGIWLQMGSLQAETTSHREGNFHRAACLSPLIICFISQGTRCIYLW